MTVSSIFIVFTMALLFPKNEIMVICAYVAIFLGYSSLLEHQKDVVTNFVARNDVFAILATGYSKSLCCACLLIFSKTCLI